MLGEEPENVALDPKVVGDDVIRRGSFAPRVALLCRRDRREVETFHRRACVEREKRLARWLGPGGDDAAHRTNRSQMASEAPGVNFLERGNLSRVQPRNQIALGAPIRVV